nr:myrosinase 1-like [Leptinotarsa decemlineata]
MFSSNDCIIWLISFTTIIIIFLCHESKKNNGSFPEGFMFGASTSAYQIEGAWNEDGKGENIWDHFIHENPMRIVNNDNADEACDSYHKYKEDVFLAASLGFSAYRISISWTRILPSGYMGSINEVGLKYYEDLIDEIVKHNMKAVVTLHHFDLPQRLQKDFGGWTNPKLIDIFVDYSRIVIEILEKVDYWITVNEPRIICNYGYGNGKSAPGLEYQEFECTKVIIMSHAAVYRMYKNEFPNRKAKMAITLDCEWFEPKTRSSKDIAAAERILEFQIGIFAHPILKGGWPKVVEDRMENRRLMENLPISQLPKLTDDEIEFINGTFDFLGVNHYYTNYAEYDSDNNIEKSRNEINAGVLITVDPSWDKNSLGRTVTTWGTRKMFKWLKETYNNPEIFISEYGYSDNGTTLEDNERIRFSRMYLSAFHDAIYKDEVRIFAALTWSLLDNFEWSFGYSAHFGLFYIDQNDPNKTRIRKKSAHFYKKLTATGRIPEDLHT